MDVHLIGEDAFDQRLQELEEIHPGITAEFNGTIRQLRYNPYVGRWLAGSREERFSFLYGPRRETIGVVVTSISGGTGSVDVEIEGVFSYGEWATGGEAEIVKRLGLD